MKEKIRNIILEYLEEEKFVDGCEEYLYYSLEKNELEEIVDRICNIVGCDNEKQSD